MPPPSAVAQIVCRGETRAHHTTPCCDSVHVHDDLAYAIDCGAKEKANAPVTAAVVPPQGLADSQPWFMSLGGT